MIDLEAAPRKARDAYVLGLRPPRNAVDPLRPNGFFVEEEPRPGGGTDRVATILLTDRECPWRCLMCDLWKNTLETPTPTGAIPAQIRFALERLPSANVLKLYSAGSFFDRAAIPVEDHDEIAQLARGFTRVVVECHPALVGESTLRFRDLLGGAQLEVAIGLETSQEEILRRLNKGMTVADFEKAAGFLRAHDIGLRSFVLLGIPFLRKEEWPPATRASIDVSFQAGARIVSLIPTRLGNGALEDLHRQGLFQLPTLRDLEMAMEDFLEGEGGRAPAAGIVLADLWDADALEAPACCRAARIERLRSMNLLQRNLPLPLFSPLSLLSPLCLQHLDQP
ncbi:MAG: radical SAM protein [Acidobacteriota bacterium]